MAAHQRKIAAASKDIAEFVAKKFPELAQGQITNYRSMVSTQAYAIGSVLGSRDKLAFYIDRLEHEPAWLARSGEDGWSNYHGELAQLRLDVKILGTLEPRLLALVIAELKHELRTHTSRGGEMYGNDNGKFFWKEKTADFAKAAEEVLAESLDGPKTNEHIARYLINSLSLWDRAIEILFAAHRRELLDESGQQLLITALFHQKRHGEAIVLLESLVRKHPKEIGWRTQLMHAYFKSRQPRALQTLLAQTKKDFIDPHPNDETMNSILAASTLENEIYEESAKYYETAIKTRTDALHGRTQGDGTLAGYFQQQAKAYSGMQNTFQAVEKASAAIVIWPARHEQRTRRSSCSGASSNMSRTLTATSLARQGSRKRPAGAPHRPQADRHRLSGKVQGLGQSHQAAPPRRGSRSRRCRDPRAADRLPRRQGRRPRRSRPDLRVPRPQPSQPRPLEQAGRAIHCPQAAGGSRAGRNVARRSPAARSGRAREAARRN